MLVWTATTLRWSSTKGPYHQLLSFLTRCMSLVMEASCRAQESSLIFVPQLNFFQRSIILIKPCNLFSHYILARALIANIKSKYRIKINFKHKKNETYIWYSDLHVLPTETISSYMFCMVCFLKAWRISWKWQPFDIHVDVIHFSVASTHG